MQKTTQLSVSHSAIHPLPELVPSVIAFFIQKKKVVNITQGFCSQVPKSTEGQILPYGPCSLFLWSWTLFLIHLGHWLVRLKSKGSWWPMLGSQAIPILLSLLLSHPHAGLKLTLRTEMQMMLTSLLVLLETVPLWEMLLLTLPPPHHPPNSSSKQGCADQPGTAGRGWLEQREGSDCTSVGKASPKWRSKALLISRGEKQPLKWEYKEGPSHWAVSL